MELKRHLNPKNVFVGLYILAFAIWIIFGLQPAEAAHYDVAAELNIPSIGLNSDVTELNLDDNKLTTPDTIVGSYFGANNKTLLIGHSTTVFQDLQSVKLGALIKYDDKTYKVTERQTVIKSHINMEKLLREENKDTLVLMTCAGELYGDGDASHRLIITAKIVE